MNNPMYDEFNECGCCGAEIYDLRVRVCPDCGDCAASNYTIRGEWCPKREEDDVDVFEDGPLGLGSDGNLHDDAYCAAIAPLGSYEARHGEACGKCMERRAVTA